MIRHCTSESLSGSTRSHLSGHVPFTTMHLNNNNRVENPLDRVQTRHREMTRTGRDSETIGRDPGDPPAAAGRGQAGSRYGKPLGRVPARPARPGPPPPQRRRRRTGGGEMVMGEAATAAGAICPQPSPRQLRRRRRRRTGGVGGGREGREVKVMGEAATSDGGLGWGDMSAAIPATVKAPPRQPRRQQRWWSPLVGRGVEGAEETTWTSSDSETIGRDRGGPARSGAGGARQANR